MDGTLHEGQLTIFIISRSFLLRMRNVSDKSCRENRNILCSITPPENRAVYEIMWKNVVERQITKWRMRFACWISKATNSHSGCVILIAFSLQ